MTGLDSGGCHLRRRRESFPRQRDLGRGGRYVTHPLYSIGEYGGDTLQKVVSCIVGASALGDEIATVEASSCCSAEECSCSTVGFGFSHLSIAMAPAPSRHNHTHTDLMTPRASNELQSSSPEKQRNWLMFGAAAAMVAYGIYRGVYLVMQDRSKTPGGPLDANFQADSAQRELALQRVFRVLQPDPAINQFDIAILDWNLLSLSSDPKWAGRGLSGMVTVERFVEVYLGVYDGTSRELFQRQVKSFEASANAIMETRASRFERLGLIYDNLDTERKGQLLEATVLDVVNRNMANMAPTQTFYKARARSLAARPAPCCL